MTHVRLAAHEHLGVWVGQCSGSGQFVSAKLLTRVITVALAMLALSCGSSGAGSPTSPTSSTPLTPSNLAGTNDVIVAGLRGGRVQQVATETGFLTAANPAFNVGYALQQPTPGQTSESWPVMEFDLQAFEFDRTNGFLNLYLVGGVDSVGCYFDSALVPAEYRTTIDDPLQIGVYGYAGDGVYDAASDAMVGSLLTTLTLKQTGPVSIDLNTFLESLLQSSERWLGLNIRPVIDPVVAQQNVAFTRPPTLGSLGSGLVPGQLQGLPSNC